MGQLADKNMIVYEMEPITLVGGAEFSQAALKRSLDLAPHIVAADGGANTALKNEVIPTAVIGDFDSFDESARNHLPQGCLHKIEEQDSTDFDKCLRNIDAPLIIGVGFSGARLDHQLATYNTLVRFPHHRCILLGSEELVFLAPPSLRLPLEPGCPVSLFPMAAVEGVSDGLRWPINGLNFAPDGRIGTSNEATGPVHLALTTPKMLIILPQLMLELAVDALLSTKAHWPEP